MVAAVTVPAEPVKVDFFTVPYGTVTTTSLRDAASDEVKETIIAPYPTETSLDS